jgi:hypothetical protein
MTIFPMALGANPHTLLLGKCPKGGSGMGVVAFKAETLADFGVLAFVILIDNLFMALSTINHAEPL